MNPRHARLATAVTALAQVARNGHPGDAEVDRLAGELERSFVEYVTAVNRPSSSRSCLVDRLASMKAAHHALQIAIMPFDIRGLN